jgi:membrane-bound lytic murein transglycosylase MltF
MKETTMRIPATSVLAAICALAIGFAPGASAQSPTAPAAAAPAQTSPMQVRGLSLSNKTWTGDFDRMLQRRMIRVDVPYSRSLYFNDKGRERGISAELVRDFERWINNKYARQLGKRPLTVYIVVATRDRLLHDVADGLADIAVGNLTVTDERRQLVDFVDPPPQKNVDEIVVTGPSSPPLASLDDLAGKTVHVRRTSSYYDSLVAENDKLHALGKPAISLVLVPDALEDEDMLEMLNAGLLQIIVVDDWKARMWAQVLPKLVVHTDLILRDNGHIGWAVRKGSEKLSAELTDFYKNWAVKQGVINYRLAQYMKHVKQLADPTGNSEWKHFEETLELFRKYGSQYSFDPLMLAAQGYQESGLNQNAKSQVGAVGVMQLMPATGSELKVGDIKQVEPNIHAGAKYMDRLMTQYFPNAHFSESNRPLFAFASYNCGPGNVARARKIAQERGLDPDKWFNNVEIVVAEKVGAETTTYVRNIYKYYVTYKLTLDAHDAVKKAREEVKPAASTNSPPAG